MILDGLQINLLSIIKAFGQQGKAQYLSFVSLFLIGLPMSYFLGVTMELGSDGLWYGFAIGLAFLVLFYSYLVLHSDWQ